MWALIGFVSAKQLAAYAGIAPSPNQSGAFKGYSRISKIGNPRLREALYMAALSAVRASEHFANFKARLEAKHKPKKLIYTAAIAVKLLLDILLGLWLVLVRLLILSIIRRNLAFLILIVFRYVFWFLTLWG